MAHFILHQHRHPERHTEPDNVPLMGSITAGQQNAVHGLVIKETGRNKIKLETKQMNPEKKTRNVPRCHELSSLLQMARNSGVKPELSLQLQFQLLFL